ncbi:MAG TPA: hypothetical protein VF175_05215 [Lacipirellula sp.]
MRDRYSIILAVLAAAFLLRVAGQALVAVGGVKFLPPMEQWYSGLIPYPVLLPVQLVILLTQAKISRDIARGAGFFAHCRPWGGKLLERFSIIYFAAMVLRYVATMYLYPERRWFSGTIPIFFHWVLAAYLFVLSRYQLSETCVAPADNNAAQGAN